MDKRAMNRGRVGERAERGAGRWLGWLGWLVNDASLGVEFCQRNGVEVCPEKGAKELGRQISNLLE